MITALSLEQNFLRKVGLEGSCLSFDESRQLVARITSGEYQEPERIVLGALLCAMQIRGESAEEIAGGALALHDIMEPIDLHEQQAEYYDVVGTGGDNKSSVSVSTATSITLSALGLAIAKHGSRAVSGKVGASDVLKQVGLNFECKREELKESFAQHGFLFLFAPLYHSSMRFAAPIRAALKFPTIFNFLGPLCNPSLPDAAAVGVNRMDRLPIMSKAAQLLGKQNYFLYSSEDGYDEISTQGVSHVYAEGKKILSIDPKVFFEPFPIPSVQGINDSAAKLRYMLSGAAQNPSKEQQDMGIHAELGLQLHNTVALNSAVVLYLFGKASSIKEAFEHTDSELRAGKAEKKLSELI